VASLQEQAPRFADIGHHPHCVWGTMLRNYGKRLQRQAIGIFETDLPPL